MEQEELHSFTFNQVVNNVEHNYRITENEEKFGVEKDGIIIAELSHQEQWVQLSGEPLGKELIERICDHIEAHYD